MKKLVRIIAIVMVVALLFSSVFGYRADSYKNAFAGVEKVLGWVSDICDSTLDAIGDMASFDFVDRWEETFGDTDYDMPTYYKCLCGKSARPFSEVKLDLMDTYGDAFVNQYVKMGNIYESMTGSVLLDSVALERGYYCTENSAFALYLLDLYTVVAYYRAYDAKGEKMPKNVSDNMHWAYCRIEGRFPNFGNNFIWRNNASKRKEFALKYTDLLISFDNDFVVYLLDYANISYYDYGVFLMPDADGVYVENELASVNKFNVKDFKE